MKNQHATQLAEIEKSSLQKYFTGLLILLLVGGFQTLTAQNKADDVVGTWLTQEGKSHIKIENRSGKYFGKIVWLREPNEEDGTPKVDDENPDEKLRTQPILGLEILKGFEFDGKDEWEDGKIYDPTDGKTYSCQMEIKDGKLEVTGYIGFSWIGRTVEWTRVK